MSKRPVSSMSSQEGEEEEASSTSAIEQQQQHKKAKVSHQEKEEDVLHGLKKGMEILVRWELIDDEVDSDDPDAVSRVWWPATVESITADTGDAILSYTGHGAEFPAETAKVRVEPDHTLRDSKGVPQEWKDVPPYKPGEEMGGDVTCPRGHASRLLTWAARSETLKAAGGKGETM
ncbi:hypothetical protein Pmar_PMAR014457 [Perkinsus marinus ATCC 50983]|uniref:Uncharacterized protein n=1 Tax=Perkinsus marinus (strain ATCC 50983 / TXsc) TaxID=423536 RepID=C5K9B1_PERM5|nr:hypothetical protein Pmar_PMAR014457 [Perkinsus marinus ATCC 50983]EER18929.1 hypothetical protein Pmar_PMAR014457 [Perkinsus marinus ATCC 50983]|eukprot:XP_002787133.1 hypothetical protein Pmar_PMAR014457 [Perkinsus marinus ATCC 50983]